MILAANGCVRMRAVVRDRYGPPEVMRLEEVAVPTPRAGQVLVRVVATSVNLSDWEGLRGWPAYARFGGLFRPSRHILGSDIAGSSRPSGPASRASVPGDEVYGDILMITGGFAEYAVAPEHALALKPAELSFAQASTLPQSGAIAVQAVARAKPRSRMLINGAGGGTGAFAVQLAAAAGIHVTGVDNAGKLDFMRSLGADEVIDYRAEDFTRGGSYDLIVDLVARRSVFAYRRALAPGGRYLIVGGTMRALLRVRDGRRGRSAHSRVGISGCWRSSKAPSSSGSSRSAASTGRCASTSTASSRLERGA